MNRGLHILTALIASAMAACIPYNEQANKNSQEEVVATVDNNTLLRSDIVRDMPQGLTDTDSITFSRMYIDNWVLNKLKMSRAEEVLSSYEKDIERLVEGYRQSLIMRQLDQYYIDRDLDTEITDKQLTSYYRANSASFKLDHNKVQGVVVKTPRSFRNASTLSTALKRVAKSGEIEELMALAEKHNLQVTDYSKVWVSYSDFLSNLPTVRTRSYNDLLSKSDVQQMTSDDANFYFIIVDVARKGEVAPLECVKEDIRRRLYAERRANIVGEYEAELKREATLSGRVTTIDSVLMKSMSYTPENTTTQNVEEATEEIIEEEIALE